jgi:hypothetical protein
MRHRLILFGAGGLVAVMAIGVLSARNPRAQ